MSHFYAIVQQHRFLRNERSLKKNKKKENRQREREREKTEKTENNKRKKPKKDKSKKKKINKSIDHDTATLRKKALDRHRFLSKKYI